MAVNITNITQVGGIYDIANLADEASGGLFWGLILIVFFIILIMNMRNAGIAKASAGSGFICLLLSLFLFYLELLQIVYPIVFMLILAGSLGFLWFESKKQ